MGQRQSIHWLWSTQPTFVSCTPLLRFPGTQFSWFVPHKKGAVALRYVTNVNQWRIVYVINPAINCHLDFPPFPSSASLSMADNDFFPYLLEALPVMRLVTVSFLPVLFVVALLSAVSPEFQQSVLLLEKQTSLSNSCQSWYLRYMFGTTSWCSVWRLIWSGNRSGVSWKGCTSSNATSHFSISPLFSIVSLIFSLSSRPKSFLY